MAERYSLAIARGLALPAAVVCLPFLHKLYGVFPLPLSFWPALPGVAATIIPVLESEKWAIRRGRIRATY